MLKPLLAFAGLVVSVTLFIPQMVPESVRTASSESNVIRQSGSGSSMLGSAEAPETRRKSSRMVRSSCDRGCSASYSSSSRTKRSKLKKSGRSVTVAADAAGHYNIVARVNGRRLPVLVDTGATSVAINKATARKLGINLKPSDFVHTANTANGKTKFAKATIRSIRIGGIVVDKVEAAVLDDRALSKTLLGMSFLKRLSKFQIEGGELKLTQ